jgi:ADP-heptose:LPS heptosyltransferase
MFKKVLVINLGGIGDVLLSTPALRAIKAGLPGVRIDILVVPRAKDIVGDLPYLSTVRFFYFGWRYFLRNIHTVRALRNNRYDLAVNMRTINSDISAQKMKLMFDVIHPGLTAGRNTVGRGSFFDVSVPESSPGDKPEMEYDLDIVRALGIEVFDRAIDLVIDAGHTRKAREILNQYGITDSDIVVGMHPGGKPFRRWPIGNFSTLMKKIALNIPCKFIITGDRREQSLSRALIRDVPGAVNLTGKLGVKELGACLQRCQLFITNDTGPMHIAAALKTPVVAILAADSRAMYSPANISDVVKVFCAESAAGAACTSKSHSHHALEAVSPDEVLSAALEFLKKQAGLR